MTIQGDCPANASHGEAARRQRGAAWAQLRRFCSGQARGRGDTLAAATGIKLQSTRKMTAAHSTLVKNAYRGSQPVAATTLLVPPELCWATGFQPFNLEMFASLLASSPAIAELASRGSASTPRCSFFNAMRGAYLAELLPQPDLVLSSSAYCEGIGFEVEELAASFQRPHLHLDIPAYRGGASSSFLADELREVLHRLCALNALPVSQGEQRLRGVMQRSSAAKKAYLEATALRRENPRLDLSLEPLLWHMNFFLYWGTETGVHLCIALRDELLALSRRPLENATRHHRLLLAIFSIFPYGRTDLWRTLLDAGACTVFEGLNWLGSPQLLVPDAIPDLQIGDLYRNLADNLVQAPMRGGEVRQHSRQYMSAAREAGAAGLVIFSHDQCQMLWPRLGALEAAAAETGLRLCVIDGDCIIGIPRGPANLRLKSFLMSLQATTAGSHRQSKRRIAASHRRMKPVDYHIGVDLGSWFSKLVILDGELSMVRQELMSSGINYPLLLKRIVDQLPRGARSRMAVAGIGGDNPSILSLRGKVLMQTTEINALVTAVRHYFTGEGELTVVDVGSQDIKVLHFDQLQAEPVCYTNRSCGAGTGCVLAQILDRWQQTDPGMTFQRLDSLALQATGIEKINTTCGIFAVTTVVSALVQAGDEHRREILRGVYQYIVTQAVRHLPPHLRDGGGRLVLVGGLASHRTMQELFSEAGFELLPFPTIAPQHAVALGTALTAAGFGELLRVSHAVSKEVSAVPV